MFLKKSYWKWKLLWPSSTYNDLVTWMRAQQLIWYQSKHIRMQFSSFNASQESIRRVFNWLRDDLFIKTDNLIDWKVYWMRRLWKWWTLPVVVTKTESDTAKTQSEENAMHYKVRLKTEENYILFFYIQLMINQKHWLSIINAMIQLIENHSQKSWHELIE